MANRKPGAGKEDLIKKDRQGVEGVRREIDEETRDGAVAALQKNRNRDAARGDWDRENRRFDEGNSRDDSIEAPRPDDAYPDRAKD